MEPVSEVTSPAVVIPVFNDPVGLEETLRSLGEEASAAVVVDDCSRCGEELESIALRHGARYLRLPENRGPGGARDRGVESVVSEFVCLLDAGVRVFPGWWRALVAHLDDVTVAAAPRVRGERVHAGVYGRYEVAAFPLDLGVSPAVVHAGGRVGYVPAAAMVWRREALVELGGFDQDLRFGEDVDLVWRCGNAGRMIRYEPQVEVHHAIRATWRASLIQRFQYGSSAGPLARRHGDVMVHALVSPRIRRVGIAGWVAGTPGALLAWAVAPRTAPVVDDPGWSRRLRARWWRTGLEQCARWARRPGVVTWPLLLLPGLRHVRWRVLASALVSIELDRHRAGSVLGPLRWAAFTLADDAAYSAGVWVSCWRERTAGPLRLATRRESP